MSTTDGTTAPPEDLHALAKGGRTNIMGFMLRLVARLPFLYVGARFYEKEELGRFALAVVAVELAALIATVGLKRGLAQAFVSAKRPHVHVVCDGMVAAFIVSLIAGLVLFRFPIIMYPHGEATLIGRLLPCVIVASAWSDISLAALAYRHNVRAAVTARAIVEPWTISVAALGFYYIAPKDGLLLAYMLSMVMALIASLVPFFRAYGLPRGWTPQPGNLSRIVWRNLPLAGADVIEWATRNIDRMILGYVFEPGVLGIYYMAQQVASLPGKLKTSFDPILGPVITNSLARNDRAAVASQVRQVGFWILAAQVGLALMGSIPGKAVMGLAGPQFVAGTAALAFLLTAEAAASTGAVCESALVYVARLQNLMISIGMLCFQITFSFALIFTARTIGWPINYQAAGPPLALLVSVALTSIIKSTYLSRLLEARVSGFRLPLLWAALAAISVGTIFTSLPKRYEWVELLIGVPAIAATYLFILYRWAFGPDDRALFAKMPSIEEATLPT